MINRDSMDILYKLSRENNVNNLYLILQLFNGNNTNLKKIITFLIERKYVSYLCANTIGVPSSTLSDNLKVLLEIGIIIPIQNKQIIDNYSIYISQLMNEKDRYKETKAYEINMEYYDFFDKKVEFFDIGTLEKIKSNNSLLDDFQDQIIRKRKSLKIHRTKNVNIFEIIKDKNISISADKIWTSIYKEIKGILNVGLIPPGMSLDQLKSEKTQLAMNKAIDILKIKDQLNDDLVEEIRSRIKNVLTPGQNAQVLSNKT